VTRTPPVLRLRALATCVLGALLLVAGCAAPAADAPAPTHAPAPAGPGCITDFDPGTDYFPVKTELTYATNVALSYERSYRVLTVQQPFPGGAPASYVLLRCGAPEPDLPPALADAPVIETPVRSVYASSTSQLPMLVEIGALDVLTGVGSPEYVSTPEVRARIEAGAVAGFAAGGQLATERILTAAPDVLLSEGTDDPAHATLRAAGVPVLGWAEFLEGGPLAQAEWIKVMGALTGRQAEAAQVFAEIERRYTELAAQVQGAPKTPVLVGQMYEGIWYVPAGGGTGGTLIRDAGGTWSEAANPGTGSIAKDFESVFVADGDARIWLADGPWATRADIVAADARYGKLPAVQSGQVWNRNKLTGPTGGNAVYERGVTHPEELLADLVAILHPDLLPDHEFVYYRQVTG
jgi:iron complex transport system substrate-binding protein